MLEYLMPKSAEVRQLNEMLEAHQAAITFQQAVDHRHAFEDYCLWYYRLAEQNQAEMQAMQNDADSFVWWLGRKKDAM